MKNVILKNSVLISATCALVFASSCYKGAERPAVVNPKAASNIFAIKDLAEITNDSVKTVYVQNGDKSSVAALDASLKQVKIEGSIDSILKRISIDANKAALNNQLKDGAIAVVVLKDQIKILKVVPDTDLNLNYDVLSMKYMKTLKQLAKTSDAAQQSSLAQQLSDLKYTSPKKLGEKFGLVELSSITIVKTGVLDNERTDYDEKKSVLNVFDKPLELSTHMVLGTEVGAAKSADDSSQSASSEE